MALSANEWAAQIAKQVGRQVAHYRAQVQDPKGKRGITAQALAERCNQLGLPLDRAVIAKLEKGMRQTITVGELLILARALGVPPLHLTLPIGSEDVAEILPGEPVDTWAAAKWFTGESDRLPGDTEATQDTETASLYREHDRLFKAYWHHQKTILMIVGTSDPELRKHRAEKDPDVVDAHRIRSAEEAMREIEDGIRFVRQCMRDLGLKPPLLGPECAYIESVKIDLTTPEGARRGIAWVKQWADRGYGTVTRTGKGPEVDRPEPGEPEGEV